MSDANSDSQIRRFRNELQQRMGYHFSDHGLLDRALTHRSASSAEHMERLEFLGDAVLGLAIAEYLHEHFPDADEGSLSRMRASLVRREGLLSVAETWGVPGCLSVGGGERSAKGVKSLSIAANAVEALIGAAFEEAGWDAARQVVIRSWKPLLGKIGQLDLRDAKSRLQELTQARGWGLPVYQVTDLGPDQSPRFQAICSVMGKKAGAGRGERKKSAEIQAAELAWEQLSK